MTEAIKPKTPEEIETLAQDVAAGLVFGSWQLQPGDPILSIFMPLAFMDKSDTEKCKEAGFEHCYEYIDKASPRSVNGFPCFFSFNWITREDFHRMLDAVKEIRAIKQERMDKIKQQ
jgi:hypothetical protein